MMSKTHIVVGVAAGLAIAQTGSVESCVAAVLGGSVGAVIPDCDISPSRAHKDALAGRLLVLGIAAIALLVDYQTGVGLCDYLVGNLGVPLIAGVLLFAALTMVGNHTPHRSFTHSLVACGCFSAAVWLACPPLIAYFALGYASHLALDMLNKQGIKLFWPMGKRFGLGWCEARGFVNSALLALGLLLSAGLLAVRICTLLI